MNIQLGDFITIAFGSKATCPARVEGFTKTGKLIIRRFNKSRDEWYPNTAKINRDIVLGEYSGSVIMFKKITGDYGINKDGEIYWIKEPASLPSL